MNWLDMSEDKMVHHLLKIQYPIIQAPMHGVTTADMVAAVSTTGALGSLPLGGLSPVKAGALINEVKSKTDKPFAINLFAHPISEIDPAAVNQMLQYLESVYSKYGLKMDQADLAALKHYNHFDLVHTVLDEQIVAVSFTFGNLDQETIAIFKSHGKLLIGTATSIEEAILLNETGVDAIVVQGFEAGGHRGTFLNEDKLPQVGLFSLLPQIADKVAIPLIAAGGIFDHRTVKAALALGASGVQIGSLFLAADESDASESYKDDVLKSTDTSTSLTQGFSGRWARGIKNMFMEEHELSGIAALPYPYQNTLTGPLRAHAKVNDLMEITSLWAGQSAAAAKRAGCAEILEELIKTLKADNIPGFTT